MQRKRVFRKKGLPDNRIKPCSAVSGATSISRGASSIKDWTTEVQNRTGCDIILGYSSMHRRAHVAMKLGRLFLSRHRSLQTNLLSCFSAGGFVLCVHSTVFPKAFITSLAWHSVVCACTFYTQGERNSASCRYHRWLSVRQNFKSDVKYVDKKKHKMTCAWNRILSSRSLRAKETFFDRIRMYSGTHINSQKNQAV